MIKKIKTTIEELKSELIDLNEYIFHNPELGFEEHKSSTAHINLLQKHNFSVEENFMGFETAFKAEFDSGKSGPTIAYLSEYDGLPEIGHGCGHNLLGTVSTGAGIVLSKLISDIGGKILVFGTPAEETGGTKVDMAKESILGGIDVVMIAHPANDYYESGKTLAMEAIQFTFKGKTAHAAGEPEMGINALDAVIGTFNSINALREHIQTDARVHGIITEGGKAANIVPDLGIAQFYVRATTKSYLLELIEKIKNCAKGSALATGTELEITNYEASYDNLITNNALSKAFNKSLGDFGVNEINSPKDSMGSSDAGNISHLCPTIQPYFSLGNENVVGHTKEFAESTIQKEAYEEMSKTIGALVLTAIDVIKNKELLIEIKEEFNNIEV